MNAREQHICQHSFVILIELNWITFIKFVFTFKKLALYSLKGVANFTNTVLDWYAFKDEKLDSFVFSWVWFQFYSNSMNETFSTLLV
jgi:hypothetical protein